MVRQEHEAVAFGGLDLDAPEAVRIGLRGAGAGQRDPVVGDHPAACGERTSLDHLIGGAGLEPRDEEDLRRVQRGKPREVDVAAVEDQDRVGRKPLLARDGDFMPLAGGDHHGRRQVAVVIEREVQLDRPLRPPERGPRKHLGAEVDHGCVQAEQLVLEAEFLRPAHLAAAGEQLVEHLLVQLPRPVRIGVGQRGAARRRDPQVGQPAFTTGEPPADLAQRIRPPQLAEQHGDELAPTGEPTRMALALRGDDDLLELRAWKKLEQLTEDAAESWHRGWPPCDVVKRRNSTGIIPDGSTPSSFRRER